MTDSPQTVTATQTPSDTSGALVLTPPSAPAAVTPAQAMSAVKLDPATEAKLDATVASFVDALSGMDPHSDAFDQKVNSIHTLGNTEIQQSAEVSNRLLQMPMRSMDQGGLGKEAPISRSLLDLRNTVESLDPSKHDVMGVHKLFNLIPFGSRLRDYFRRYESAQTHLNAIMQALYDGQDQLRQDQAAVEQEKSNLWAIMQRLQQYIYMAQKLDTALTAKIASVQGTDPDRAKALQEDALFYVRQKSQDLLTQLAVSVQGYLALDVIKKNDLELIKGVDRATTTTISALRTAVIAAQALANEKLVLDQITALNTTTSNLIESTSEMLRTQTGQIYAQAASSTIDLNKLQAAFQNIYATMDSIDQYKLQALDTMQQTVTVLTDEVNKAQTYLDRAHRDPGEVKIAAVASTLQLPEASQA